MDKLDIVKQARTWIGTPYHHQGRVKNVGADCIGLLVGVFKELNLMSQNKDFAGNTLPLHTFDNTVYSQNPNGRRLQEVMGNYLKQKEIKDLEPGDIVLMCWAKFPQHVAIISDYSTDLGLIHIYKGAGKCVEHSLDPSWNDKIVEAYEVSFNG